MPFAHVKNILLILVNINFENYKSVQILKYSNYLTYAKLFFLWL
jgi:hypothetical protein